MTLDRFSLWFIPAQPELSELTEVINRLARTWKTSPFTPHLTGFSGRLNGMSPKRLEATLSAIPAFSLAMRGLEDSDYFFKTFYAALEASPILEAAAVQLATETRAAPYQLHPHVSLIYKESNVEEREMMAISSSLSYASIHFDQAWLVMPKNPDLGWRDIENLDIPLKIPLADG